MYFLIITSDHRRVLVIHLDTTKYLYRDEKNPKMNWILFIFYNACYAVVGRLRQNSVTIKNIIFSKIFYCLEIVSRFTQTMQSSEGWKPGIFSFSQNSIVDWDYTKHISQEGLFIMWLSNYCSMPDKWSIFWTSCCSETMCWVSICLSSYLNG